MSRAESTPESAADKPEFPKTVAILGTGLIGGSFGLALKAARPSIRIVGFDREGVLERAIARGAIDSASATLEAACTGVELVLVAAPVGSIIEMLPRIARCASPGAIVTDTGSTKVRIHQTAAREFAPDDRAIFIGGHPMAGRESGGIENADSRMFQESRWILCEASAGQQSAARQRLEAIVRAIGATPIEMTSHMHDETMAMLSHLPQLISTALAARLHEDVVADGRMSMLDAAGPGIRDMTRLAASSYELWRDILMTNSDEIERTLCSFQQTLDHLRENLKSREVEKLFAAGAELRSMLLQRGPGGGKSE